MSATPLYGPRKLTPLAPVRSHGLGAEIAEELVARAAGNAPRLARLLDRARGGLGEQTAHAALIAALRDQFWPREKRRGRAKEEPLREDAWLGARLTEQLSASATAEQAIATIDWKLIFSCPCPGPRFARAVKRLMRLESAATIDPRPAIKLMEEERELLSPLGSRALIAALAGQLCFVDSEFACMFGARTKWGDPSVCGQAQREEYERAGYPAQYLERFRREDGLHLSADGQKTQCGLSLNELGPASPGERLRSCGVCMDRYGPQHKLYLWNGYIETRLPAAVATKARELALTELIYLLERRFDEQRPFTQAGVLADIEAAARAAARAALEQFERDQERFIPSAPL